jgi:hypothetical protein
VRYPASRGYVLYSYREEHGTITLAYTSCADKAKLRIPLGPGLRVAQALLNGKKVDLQTEVIEKSSYAVVEVEGRRAHHLQLELDAMMS